MHGLLYGQQTYDVYLPLDASEGLRYGDDRGIVEQPGPSARYGPYLMVYVLSAFGLGHAGEEEAVHHAAHERFYERALDAFEKAFLAAEYDRHRTFDSLHLTDDV